MSKEALEKELATINNLGDEKKRLLKEVDTLQQQVVDYKFENQKVTWLFRSLLTYLGGWDLKDKDFVSTLVLNFYNMLAKGLMDQSQTLGRIQTEISPEPILQQGFHSFYFSKRDFEFSDPSSNILKFYLKTLFQF